MGLIRIYILFCCLQIYMPYSASALLIHNGFNPLCVPCPCSLDLYKEKSLHPNQKQHNCKKKTCDTFSESSQQKIRSRRIFFSWTYLSMVFQKYCLNKTKIFSYIYIFFKFTLSASTNPAQDPKQIAIQFCEELNPPVRNTFKTDFKCSSQSEIGQQLFFENISLSWFFIMFSKKHIGSLV